MEIPGIFLTGYVDFRKNFADDPTTLSVTTTPPTPIHSGYYVRFFLSNLSGIEQTGTLGFKNSPNSVVGAASACCPTVSGTAVIGLCGTSEADRTSRSGGLPPDSVNWRIPANGIAIVVATAVYSTVFANTPTGTNSWGQNFRPAFTLSVNEDRGAVLGRISISHIQTSAVKICSSDSTAVSNGAYGKYISVDPLPGEISLNGGRPF